MQKLAGADRLAKKGVARMEQFVNGREDAGVTLPEAGQDELKTLQNEMDGWQEVRRRTDREEASSSGPSESAGAQVDPDMAATKRVRCGLKMIRRGKLRAVARKLKTTPSAGGPKQKLARQLLEARLFARHGKDRRSRSAFDRALLKKTSNTYLSLIEKKREEKNAQ